MQRLVDAAKASKRCRERASFHLLRHQAVAVAATGWDNLDLGMHLCCVSDRRWVGHLDQGRSWFQLLLLANFRLARERLKGPRVPAPLRLLILKDGLVISYLLLDDKIRLLLHLLLLRNICLLLLRQLFSEIEVAALIDHHLVDCFI